MNLDVLVVGAGPVGLTMAAELARYEVSVRIVDKAAQRTDKSKALVLWSRSLELIDRMGCGDSFVASGLKATAANIFAGSRQIAHIRLDTIATPHPYALMLPQSETERLLEQHLCACGVQVDRSVELLRFVAGPATVCATLRHADGREETVEAAWLVGCDGAHSTVRHGLGMEFEGDTLPTDWFLADVQLTGVTVPPDEIPMFWHADGVLALFPIAAGRYRVIADLGDAHGETDRSDPTLAEVQAVLDDRGPGGLRAASPNWLSSFRISERIVPDYRAGRVFLAGDAAHIHSPAGGQGMNTGIQDACNLAWKLALVQRGLAAAEPLLGSYSVERRTIGRQVLADTGRLTMVAVLHGGVAQVVRNHVAALVFGLAPVRRAMTNALSELSIGYPDSPLTGPGRHFHPEPAAGQRVPVRDGETPVGTGSTPLFCLFAPADAAHGETIARHRNILDPTVRPPFADNCLWLVRPDGYVAMVVGRESQGDVDAYLERIAAGTPQKT